MWLDVIVRDGQSCPDIRDLKEAGVNQERVNQMKQVLPASYGILRGDDSRTLPFMAVGAEGVISVASNLLPREVSRLVRLAGANDFAAATRLHRKLYPAFRALFVEPNPVPVKHA